MVFARCKATWNLWNYYSEHTEVWTFGTADDYSSFAAHLDRHAAGESSHTCLPPMEGSPGMDVVLLPTCLNAQRPFLMMHERCVHLRGQWNMELVIGGTPEGFALLRDEFSRMVRDAFGASDEHCHVDFGGEILVAPAVILNIRGPVQQWSAQELGRYWSYCAGSGGAHRFPSGLALHGSVHREYSLPGYEGLPIQLPMAPGD